jgi:5-methylcytosine-specific restriction endonuclease McrA
MAKTSEQKAAYAAKEKQRRIDDKIWLASLSESERAAVKAKRSAADKARRSKFKATLTPEEIIQRKKVDAEKDAERYYRKIEEQGGPKPKLCKFGHDLALTRTGDNGRCGICRKDRMEEQKTNGKNVLYAANKKAKIEALPAEEKEAVKLAQQQYTKDYYQANKPKILEEKKLYYAENREDILKDKKQYHVEHREERRVYSERYYASNKHEINEARRLDYAENAEEICAERRVWNKANRHIVREWERAARNNRRGAPGKITKKNIVDIFEQSGGICSYCLKETAYEDHELEHCLPLSRGGSNYAHDCVMSCESCNRRKSSRTPLEFLFGWPRVTKKYPYVKTELLDIAD